LLKFVKENSKPCSSLLSYASSKHSLEIVFLAQSCGINFAQNSAGCTILPIFILVQPNAGVKALLVSDASCASWAASCMYAEVHCNLHTHSPSTVPKASASANMSFKD
jgi:hypothetical protein